jgi:hypothetical protein
MVVHPKDEQSLLKTWRLDYRNIFTRDSQMPGELPLRV